MIQVYSTQERKKVEFKTHTPNTVRMYVCGPTVYDSCHIGHARPAVVFDTIRRYLEYAGNCVIFISNITDIDDKIINRANELGISTEALARRYQDEYEADMSLLGVRSPTIRPRATEHIQEMIDLIQDLMDKEIAYATDRGVWFDVTKFEGYGKLSGRVTDDENTEHRVEEDSEKRNPQDWALWKFSKPGEPAWPSPWGEGRPGWHIECSAMGGKYAEFELDIHGGGADLTFPHHENEIAQSEACSGKCFATYWLHNGFITVAKDDSDEGEKMGKSKGNAFWLRQAFKQAPPAAIRLWILGTHYRAPLLYKSDSISGSLAQLDRIYNSLDMVEAKLATGNIENGATVADVEKAKTEFENAMNDDFNTPKALASLHELVGWINTALNNDTPLDMLHTAHQMLLEILTVLGLPLQKPEAGSSDEETEGLVNLLVSMRDNARKNKDFATSDQIRDGLASMNIEIRDTPTGESQWQRTTS